LPHEVRAIVELGRIGIDFDVVKIAAGDGEGAVANSSLRAGNRDGEAVKSPGGKVGDTGSHRVGPGLLIDGELRTGAGSAPVEASPGSVKGQQIVGAKNGCNREK